MRVPCHRLGSSIIIELWCGPQFCKGRKGGQIFAKRSRYARSTPRLRRRLANFPWRTISIRPAVSSSLRWWDSVAALTLCFLCSALHAAGPAQAPISLSISKRRGSASARAMRANCRSVRRGAFVAAAVIVGRETPRGPRSQGEFVGGGGGREKPTSIFHFAQRSSQDDQ